MCTAISFVANNLYFGRTLDVEFDILPSVVVTPRNYTFSVSNKKINSHFAVIGMALPVNNHPLYFDASNEAGLAMAGLNFPKNAYYFEQVKGKLNVPVSDFILYILSTCKSVEEAKMELNDLVLVEKNPYSMPTSPLHFIISDKKASITVEQTTEGLKVYDNSVGVLTNNPPFNWHMLNLANYLNITSDEPTNRMLNDINIVPYCKGMGGIGLPGDLSSASRFIRATFTKFNAKKYANDSENIHQFFHILESVFQTEGLAKAGDSYEKSLYTSCIDVDNSVYYYKTYQNSRINAVKMQDIDGSAIQVYKLNTNCDINYQN